MSGTVELRTKRLLLRRYRPEDAAALYRKFGCDPEIARYTGWNPYETEEMTRKTVADRIVNYTEEHAYGWAIEHEGELIGTAGAYDYDARQDSIELGYSIERDSWGKGFASEAVQAVVNYLTEQEGISRILAWCASDNIGSQKVLGRAGLQLIRTEKDALQINGQAYDQLFYEYKKPLN